MNVRHDMVSVFVLRRSLVGRTWEFLQLRRSPDDYMGGTWQIVRGTSNVGETAVQAALRELREETGLSPTEFYRLGLMESFYISSTDTVWHVPCFAAIVPADGEVKLNEEHDAFRWVSRDRIDAETMWASERAVLAEVTREIIEGGIAKEHMRLAVE